MLIPSFLEIKGAVIIMKGGGGGGKYVIIKTDIAVKRLGTLFKGVGGLRSKTQVGLI